MMAGQQDGDLLKLSLELTDTPLFTSTPRVLWPIRVTPAAISAPRGLYLVPWVGLGRRGCDDTCRILRVQCLGGSISPQDQTLKMVVASLPALARLADLVRYVASRMHARRGVRSCRRSSCWSRDGPSGSRELTSQESKSKREIDGWLNARRTACSCCPVLCWTGCRVSK
jgi:hypothetical protein